MLRGRDLVPHGPPQPLQRARHVAPKAAAGRLRVRAEQLEELGRARAVHRGAHVRKRRGLRRMEPEPRAAGAGRTDEVREVHVEKHEPSRELGMRRGERLRDERTEAEPHEHHRAAVHVELNDKRAQVLDQRVFVVRARAVAVSVAAEVGGPRAVAAPRERDAEVAQSPASLAEVVKEHHVHDVGVVGLAPDVVPQPRADGERQELLRPRAEDAVPERLRFGERRAPLGGRDPERASRERRGDGLARGARLLAGGGGGEHA